MTTHLTEPTSYPTTLHPRVIGLDISITSTGLADFTHHGREVTTKTIRSKPAAPSTTAMHTRLTRIVHEITEHITRGPHPALIVVEGPSYSSKGNALHQIAGLWWLTIDALTIARHPIAVVPPSVLKKYATGRGNADKTAMAVALAKRADGYELRDDNQVDAWWLAAAGRDHLGVPYLPMPKAQREALDAVTWPEVTA